MFNIFLDFYCNNIIYLPFTNLKPSKMLQAPTLPKVILSSLLFIAILALGIVLSKTGKPYNSFLVAGHKLLSLTLVVYVAVYFIGAAKGVELSVVFYIFSFVLLISVVALFASGAMLSMDKHAILMQWTHRFATVGFIVSLAIVFYRVASVKF